MICAECRLTNGPSGPVDSSLPAAISAAVAYPNTTVFARLGDGPAGFRLSDFESAAREQTAFAAIIGSDSTWNAEHHTQDVRYHDAAEAMDASGYRASTVARPEFPNSFTVTRKTSTRITDQRKRPYFEERF